eukprot:3280591-Pyramimonas_sp.AAC.1
MGVLVVSNKHPTDAPNIRRFTPDHKTTPNRPHGTQGRNKTVLKLGDSGITHYRHTIAAHKLITRSSYIHSASARPATKLRRRDHPF